MDVLTHSSVSQGSNSVTWLHLEQGGHEGEFSESGKLVEFSGNFVQAQGKI